MNKTRVYHWEHLNKPTYLQFKNTKIQNLKFYEGI
jgi:hypothetical protein